MSHLPNNQPAADNLDDDRPIVDAAIAPPTRSDLPDPILESDRDPGIDHPAAAAIGAAGGGAAGAVIGNAIGGKMGAAVGAVGGAVVGAIVGNQAGEFTNPSPPHVVPLRDEDARFVWQLRQADQSRLVWELCPKHDI